MIVENLIAWEIPFVCGGIITGIVAHIKTLKKRIGAIGEGVQCILRAEIKGE